MNYTPIERVASLLGKNLGRGLDSKVEGIIDSSCRIMGKVVVGKYTVTRSSTRIKVIIGEVCEIGQNVYIEPYTSIDDDVRILSG